MTQAPKGTHDIYGEEMRLWRKAETEIRSITDVFGYHEIRTPMFEATELFLRGVGDTTDIVQKEMYTFQDKGGRSMTLRPEQTAGVARAFIERGLHNAPQPTKVFYIGPCFRYEKPQSGRYRQHYQFGVECFGAGSPAVEAEVISLGHTLISRLSITGVQVHINSIGCVECRIAYNEKLRAFLAEKLESLCGLCAGRYEKNPLRVLDCKSPNCQAQITEAPATTSCLCKECENHFATLQDLLTQMGVPYIVDAKVVRGLDYYTRTVFEFIKDGGQTVIGGGRYDGLIKQLGGTDTPAVGFGMGMERLTSLINETNPTDETTPVIFIGHADEKGFTAACKLTDDLRKMGIRAVNDPANRSVKAQMKYADKINARFTTILGESEVTSGACKIRNMQTREEITLPLANVSTYIQP